MKSSPHPPLQGHGADVPPPPVQTVAGLLDGVALRVATARVGIMEQDIAEREHRRHALGVLLDVPLQVLQDGEHGSPLVGTRVCSSVGQTATCALIDSYFDLAQQKDSSNILRFWKADLDLRIKQKNFLAFLFNILRSWNSSVGECLTSRSSL